MKCLKHEWMFATRILIKNGEKYPMCADCAWSAYEKGETLYSIDMKKKIYQGKEGEVVTERV